MKTEVMDPTLILCLLCLMYVLLNLLDAKYTEKLKYDQER